MTIMSLLNQIENDEIVLPAIQRDFVWDEDKTAKLLDSILRGYPIGTSDNPALERLSKAG